ncbi:unnamed protein product [Clonostachys rhizophaga]|uniref:Uncharacterized protein n=1 Tax=Clonostachys rhizophaga TaxID=160324 RepID=A0A9N9VYV2_9HYPO|nr:unnamed protein product [Clonostachys rhizophaga]
MRSPRKVELGTSKLQQPALAAFSQSVSELGQVQSEDGKALLVLLSFLAPENAIHVDNLLLGASPRKRWTAQGAITDMDAVNAGLFPELCNLLSDRGKLTAALGELGISGLNNHGNGTYSLEKTISDSIRRSVPPEYLRSWRCQALLVAYRAVSWKYTEPLNPNTQLFLPHVRHTLHETKNFNDPLPRNIQIDLATTLLEASRLPNLSWKRFALDEAAVLSKDFANWEIDCRIAQSRAVLARITGQVDQAFACLDATRKMPSNADQKSHSVLGQEILQRALNSIQVERLQEARELLDSWKPLTNHPSPLEKIIIFRKTLLMGSLLRFQGTFEESITHLRSAHELLDASDEIAFDEELRDLFCELADTLRELDNPQLAETYLQSEIARRTVIGITASAASLELCLAEALFAQGRLKAAEVICKNIRDRPALLRFERLRLHLLFGRLYFETNDLDSLTHWSAALKEAGNFRLTNGRTTRIIVLSICDILRRLGHTELVQQSMQQVAFLDEAADPMAINHWIAGMRHWQQYLQSSRSKI